MIPSRWVGRVILATMLAVVFASLSMTMPLFAVGIVDDYGHSHNEVVVYKDYIQHHLVLSSGLSAMLGFAAMMWVWMLLALIFVGLLLFNSRRASVISGWILAINGMVALSFLTANLGAASGNLTYSFPYIKGFYGRVTSSAGAEWAWGPELGWWFLVVAVVLQSLAVAMRTYVVFLEYHDHGAGTGPPPVQDAPKPT